MHGMAQRQVRPSHLAAHPVFANLETTMRSVVRCGSLIGASVALWREPGCHDRRGAVVVEVLAAGSGSGRPASTATQAPPPKESSRAARPDERFATCDARSHTTRELPDWRST